MSFRGEQFIEIRSPYSFKINLYSIIQLESVVTTDKTVFIKSARLFCFGQEVLRDSTDHLIISVKALLFYFRTMTFVTCKTDFTGEKKKTDSCT